MVLVSKTVSLFFFTGQELIKAATKYLSYHLSILMGVLDVQLRCLFCGRIIEEEPVYSPDPLDDDYDDDIPEKKPLAVCIRCQAKIKHEADESQKLPKPM